MKSEDLLKQTFGELTPVSIDETRKNRIFWLCKCSCGQLKSVAAKHLKNGSVRTCRASVHFKGKKGTNWRGYEDISQKYWGNIQKGARVRNLKFSLTQDQVWRIFIQQEKKCALSGLPLFLIGKNGGQGNASLDRINSELGYLTGNIQWVDKRINKMKMDLPEIEFKELCFLVTKNANL